jgi:hypothetical protein
MSKLQALFDVRICKSAFLAPCRSLNACIVGRVCAAGQSPHHPGVSVYRLEAHANYYFFLIMKDGVCHSSYPFRCCGSNMRLRPVRCAANTTHLRPATPPTFAPPRRQILTETIVMCIFAGFEAAQPALPKAKHINATAGLLSQETIHAHLCCITFRYTGLLTFFHINGLVHLVAWLAAVQTVTI